MIQNSTGPNLQETDTTDCSCMELYNRNNKHHQTAGRPLNLRSHQSHPRVNNNFACLRCRKRKPGNAKNLQHCPSCFCPPDIVRSLSGRLRGAEHMEDVLTRFEEITRNPREPGSNQCSNTRQAMSLQSKNVPKRSNVKKTAGSSLNSQERKNEHDQMLKTLYRDLRSSGLASEETQGCMKYQTPIKSVRKKCNLGGKTEHIFQTKGGNLEESIDLDSDAVLKYFRDYEKQKVPHTNILLKKEESLHRQQRTENHMVASRIQNNEIDEDENELRQLEIDNQELNKLSQEVREYEMKKFREKRQADTEYWEKHKKLNLDDGDNLRHRNVSFHQSKLPVPMSTGENSKNRNPPGDNIEICENSNGKMTETRINYHSTSIPENNQDEEYDNENLENFNYPNKESGDSLSQDVKDIPYCDVAFNCRFPSSQTPHENQNQISEEQSLDGNPGIRSGQDQSDQLASVDQTKKYNYGGAGDLDLHASKSYIVDLIDRALSRELGTIPEDRKKTEIIPRPIQSQKEICVEIARALQGDYYPTYSKNGNNVEKETPDYVKHLKTLRWDYLNHIQDELKKLQDLERILDTYSPRQSLQLPIQQSQQIPNLEKKTNHHQNIN